VVITALDPLNPRCRHIEQRLLRAASQRRNFELFLAASSPNPTNLIYSDVLASPIDVTINGVGGGRLLVVDFAEW
jgi:hypothetical protein